MVSTVKELKEVGRSQWSFFPWKLDIHSAKKIMYRCLGIAVFVAAFVPANIVAWIFLFEVKNVDDISTSQSNKNNSLGDSMKAGRNSSSLTLEVITSTMKPIETVIDDKGAVATLKCHERIDEYNELRKEARLWIEGILLLIFGIFGIFGNIVSIIVLPRCPGNRNFNVLLMYLSVIDAFVVTDMVVQKSIVYHFTEPLWFRVSYPFFWHPIKGILLSATIFMVIAVSAERFRAICYPFSDRHSPHKYAIMVIFGAVLLKIPRFFHFQLNEEGSDYATSPLMENTAYIWANAYWDDLMITGFIPLLILIYFNLRIYLRILKSRKLRVINPGPQSCLRANRSVSVANSSIRLCDKHARMSINTIISATSNRNDSVISRLISEKESQQTNPTRYHDSFKNRSRKYSKRVFRRCSMQNEAIEMASFQKANKQYSMSFNELKLSKSETESLLNSIKKNVYIQTPKLQRFPSSIQEKRREKRFELRRSVSDYSFHEEIKPSRFDDNALSKSKNHLKVPGSESLKTSNMTFGRIKSNSIAAPIVCTCFQATGSYQKESQKNMDRNIPAEKSSLILVAIVLVFLLSHSFRLALKVYEVLMPQGNTFENFKRCFSLGRHHVPVAFYILFHLNNLFIVVNSSVNFIIYCCVAKPFRMRVLRLLRLKGCIKRRGL